MDYNYVRIHFIVNHILTQRVRIKCYRLSSSQTIWVLKSIWLTVCDPEKLTLYLCPWISLLVK